MLQEAFDAGFSGCALKAVLKALEVRNIDLEIIATVPRYEERLVSSRGYLRGKFKWQVKGCGPLYKKVFLYVHLGCIKSLKMHRIVVASFLDRSWSFSECDHLDGNPANNRLTNLRPASRQL